MAKNKEKKKSYVIKFCLSVLPVIGMLSIGGVLCFVDIPQENKAYLTLILGALITLAKEASGYYFQPEIESDREIDEKPNIQTPAWKPPGDKS